MWQFKSLKAINIISFKNVEFNFRNGKAILVTGSNLDDHNQKVNGSGKSSLIESIAIAISGNSIRDVKVKELIYNGCPDGVVELKLFNSQLDKELVIWRKIYANTKSAEARAWINGEDQCALYSDINGFNAWIWKTLGISKEDFFSFYLITSDAYEPFLSVGDVKKKEIINRFSGADKVDTVFPEIEKDSKESGLNILQQERLLLTNTTKQELLTSQLEEAKEEVSEDKKNELIESKVINLQTIGESQAIILQEIEAIEFQIQSIDSDIYVFNQNAEAEIKLYEANIAEAKKNLVKFQSESNAALQPFKDELEIAELEVETFEFTKDYDTELKKIKNEVLLIKSEIVKKTTSISTVKDKFEKEINDLVAEELEYKNQITEAQEALKYLEQFESDVNKKLLDSIVCPACSHTFNLKDKTFNAAEAKAELPQVILDIAEHKEIIATIKEIINVDIQAGKTAINNKILAAQELINNEISILNNVVTVNGQDEARINQEKQLELNKKQVFLDAVKTATRKLENKKEDIGHDLIDYINAVRKQENLLTNKKDENGFQKQKFTNLKNSRIQSLNQKESEIRANDESMLALEKQIEVLRSTEPDQTKILKIQADIDKLQIEQNRISIKLEEFRKEKESIDAWELNFKSFKSTLANKSIKNIEDFSNLYLQNMGSNLQICIDGYKTLSSKKIKESISTSVLRDGFDAGSYGKFSGGERGRIDISVILSISELINLNSKYGGIDFLCADEILDQVDVVGIESIVNSIQTLGKTIMIVSQNEINTGSDHTLVIQKQNKVSTILN